MKTQYVQEFTLKQWMAMQVVNLPSDSTMPLRADKVGSVWQWVSSNPVRNPHKFETGVTAKPYIAN